MKIAILSSKQFMLHAKKIQKFIKNSIIFDDHRQIFHFDIVFILYDKLVDSNFLKTNGYKGIICVSKCAKSLAANFYGFIEQGGELKLYLLEFHAKIYLEKSIHGGKDEQLRSIIGLCLDFIKLCKKIPKSTPILKQLSCMLKHEQLPVFSYRQGRKIVLKIYIAQAQYIILSLNNYIYSSKKMREKVRSLRNHPHTKRYLYTSHYISKLEHKNFIDKLKKTNKKTYFYITYDKIIVGSINFSLKDELEFGFYANPYLHCAGLGRILEQIAIYYSFTILKCQTISLYAFKENAQIINLHKKFGFLPSYEDEKIIKMQLKGCK